MEKPRASVVINLFGRFEATVDGRPFKKSCLNEKLLALLCLSGGGDVSRTDLAHDLWPDREDRQKEYLRRSLWQLGKSLGLEARYLDARNNAIRLDVSAWQVDVLAFDQAIREADRHPSHDSMEKAVSLYSGPLLSDWHDLWIAEQREGRIQKFQKALRRLSDYSVASHDYDAAKQYLRRAIDADPAVEEIQRALMDMLRYTGRYREASKVFQELNSYLRQHFQGTLPEPKTTLLHRQILEEGRQANRLHQPDQRPNTAPITSKIPRPLTRIVGRTGLIRTLNANLISSRLVTLLGFAGVGKTRLALEIAQDLKGAYHDGAFFVELAPLTSSASTNEQIVKQIASTLGAKAAGANGSLDALVSYLEGKQALIVLDNCEHLVSETAPIVEHLLKRCPDLSMLVTSREQLGVPGERKRRVPPLVYPERKSSSGTPPSIVSDIQMYSAVDLFVERAQDDLDDFCLTDQNVDTVTQICRMLDGIPLAIELAASRLSGLSINEVCAGLNDRFHFLERGNGRTTRAKRTLRQTIDWSYNLLSREEAILLDRLSIFRGGCTLDAVRHVCIFDSIWPSIAVYDLPDDFINTHAVERSILEADLEIPPIRRGRLPFWEMQDLLTSLVDKSLVSYKMVNGQGRYYLLETLREYAYEKLRAAGEAVGLHIRHYCYYYDLEATLEFEDMERKGVKFIPGTDMLDDPDYTFDVYSGPDRANFSAASSYSFMVSAWSLAKKDPEAHRILMLVTSELKDIRPQKRTVQGKGR